jgi:hypothetical protein
MLGWLLVAAYEAYALIRRRDRTMSRAFARVHRRWRWLSRAALAGIVVHLLNGEG